MYLLIFSLILGGAGLLIFFGIHRKLRKAVAAGITVAVLLFLFLIFMDFWGEKLWFDSLGFSDRFWIEVLARLATAGLFLLIGAGLMPAWSITLKGLDPRVRTGLTAGSAILGGVLGLGSWEAALRFINRVDTGTADPLLGLDTGFYLFSLPFIEAIYGVLVTIALLLVGIGFVSVQPQGAELLKGNFRDPGEGNEQPAGRALFTAAAILLLVLSIGRVLKRYRLLYAYGGVVSGPGWTDDNIRLPLLLVAPNEITYERPYIEHNIAFTRQAFKLDTVREEEFPVGDIDVDRYDIDGRRRWLWWRRGKWRPRTCRVRARTSSIAASSIPTATESR